MEPVTAFTCTCAYAVYKHLSHDGKCCPHCGGKLHSNSTLAGDMFGSFVGDSMLSDQNDLFIDGAQEEDGGPFDRGRSYRY